MGKENNKIICLDQECYVQMNNFMLEIILSIDHINKIEKYKPLLTQYKKQIEKYMSYISEKNIIDLLNHLCEKFSDNDKAKTIPFLIIENNIKMHFFLLQIMLDRIS